MAPHPISTVGSEVFLSKEALAEAVMVHGETMVALATVYATRPWRNIRREDLMDATEHIDSEGYPVIYLGNNDLASVTSRFLGRATVGIPLVYGNEAAGRRLGWADQLLHLAQSWASSLSRDVVAVAALRITEDESHRDNRVRIDETICLYVDKALEEAAALSEITLGERATLENTPGSNGTYAESVIMTACITGIFRMMAGQGEEKMRVALQTAILALLESWGYSSPQQDNAALTLI